MVAGSQASGLIHAIGQTDPGAVGVELVGGKAHSLMRLAWEGLPVPAGFVLDTRAWRAFRDAGDVLPEHVAELVTDGVRSLERSTGMEFGGRRRPLLLAVRSGAAVSMPGMLDTILNVGLTDATLRGLLRETGDPLFVWDSYRRLVQAHGETVAQLPASLFTAVLHEACAHQGVAEADGLDVAALRDAVRRMQDIHRDVGGRGFPQDPMEQLRGAVEAVLHSWNSPRAVEYRAIEHLDGEAGTAVTVQAMVFGNRGLHSGSGVGFTRDPATGQSSLYVDFGLHAQGDDIVSGRSASGDSAVLIGMVPGLAGELEAVRRRLEELFGDVQDFEFTVEEGRLWLLQSRAAKRTPWAALQIACDLVDEGVIDSRTAGERLRTIDLEAIGRTRLAGAADQAPAARGVPAGGGAVSGRAALSVAAARALAETAGDVVLVRDDATPEDVAGLAVCRGLLTARGARTSHAAVVARQLGVGCVVSCDALVIDSDRGRFQLGDTQLREGDAVTVDGATGLAYAGPRQVVVERPVELIARARTWLAEARSERQVASGVTGSR